jgi:hypothetical protein
MDVQADLEGPGVAQGCVGAYRSHNFVCLRPNIGSLAAGTASMTICCAPRWIRTPRATHSSVSVSHTRIRCGCRAGRRVQGTWGLHLAARHAVRAVRAAALAPRAQPGSSPLCCVHATAAQLPLITAPPAAGRRPRVHRRSGPPPSRLPRASALSSAGPAASSGSTPSCTSAASQPLRRR